MKTRTVITIPFLWIILLVLIGILGPSCDHFSSQETGVSQSSFNDLSRDVNVLWRTHGGKIDTLTTTQDTLGMRVGALETGLAAQGQRVDRTWSRQMDFSVALDSLTRKLQKVIDEQAAMNALFDSLFAASVAPGQADSVEIVLGGIELRRIETDVWPFEWWHNFKDISGADEIKLEFEVGFQQYSSLDEVAAGTYASVWQGYRTVSFPRANLERFGQWSAVDGWRMQFQSTIYGLEAGKFYVFSCRARDGAGNFSDWMTTIDSTLVNPPYIVFRVR